MNYVDLFIPDADGSQFGLFIAAAMNYLKELNGYTMIDGVDATLCDTVFLIDQNMVYIPDDFYENDAPLDMLCSYSPFLRLLLNYFINEFGITVNCYQDCADALKSHNIRLLLLYEDDEYIDILKMEPYGHSHPDTYTYTYAEVGPILQEQGEDQPGASHICAFGFWTLTDSFFRLLYSNQINELESYDCPIYVFPIKPINSDENELDIITPSDLLSNCSYDSRTTLLQALRGWLGANQVVNQ